jgi:uncharacterized protein (TIGR02099 family)
MTQTLSPSSAPAPQASPRRKPSLWLRAVHAAISAVWWVVVGLALITVLGWGLLHGFIVPRIDQLRPEIESRLTQTLGMPVRIGSIAAQSATLVPSFILRDVRLLDTQGRDALHLQRVLAALSPRSLWNLDFEQLVIDQPELNIRRDKQGHIFVAGLDMSAPATDTNPNNPVANWFFSQREFVIRQGIVRWTDELRTAPTLALHAVDVVVRNPGSRHLLRVDASPSAEWGERFSIVGDFRHAFMRSHAGRWQEWEGAVYANFARVDVSQLKRHADLGFDISRGLGGLRLWGNVSKGQFAAGTADVALSNFDVQLAKNLQPLSIASMQGRIAGKRWATGLEFATEGLQFSTRDGIQWPGGNLSFKQNSSEGNVDAGGSLQADRLDLSALAQIADRLPIGTTTHTLIRSFAPKGLVESVQTSWKGAVDAPKSYEAKGTVNALELASAGTGRPGVRGASVDFKLNQAGGEAKIAIQKGSLDLPGAFEDPVLLLDSLTADAKWTIKPVTGGDKIELLLPNIKFANLDAQGEAQARWQTADAAKSNAKSRFPGILDLQGTLMRADIARVSRYLPVVVPKPAREYVRNSLIQGNMSAGKFKLIGDLHDLPFTDPASGEFRISADIKNATFAYAPASVLPANSLPWPALTQVQGEFVFDRASLALNSASARMDGNSSLVLTKADARIPDLTKNQTVIVSTDARGPAADLLALVNSSPLSVMTSQSLSKATANGNADIRLRLNLPIFALEKSKVLGSITLTNSDVQITPDTPLLAQAKGIIAFSESGFALREVQTRMLGGDMRLEGGSPPANADSDAGPVFRAQGSFTSEGLQQSRDLGFVSRLALNATGNADYTATLGFKRGVAELTVDTDLQGMALNLPAPLNKAADTVLPLRYENSLVKESLAPGQKLQDQLLVDLGRILSVAYVRDVSGAEPQVVRGGIGVGLNPGESAPAGDNAVLANLNLTSLNVDVWAKLLASLSEVNQAPASSDANRVPGGHASRGSAVSGYLPSVLAVRAQELTTNGRKLNNVVAGGSREGLVWRANLDARELNGYVEYRQASDSNAGKVYARLARLSVAASAAADIESVLEEQPASIPALDIVVEDFELRGKKLGRVEIEALNRGGGLVAREGGAREWRLTKFSANMPEAQFNATGNWVAVNAQASAGAGLRPSRAPGERRRMVMNFKLDIQNAGELLKRLGLEKAIANGKGLMEGQISWLGSPLALDYPSLSGAFNVNIENGRFLQVDAGAAKLLGVLSLQSLPRRLTLDFRDVFSDGFSFDFIRGDVKIDQGVAATNNLQMKGINAAVLMEGSTQIATESIDLKVVVVPEINAGTASLIATVINPAVGLGTFLAQLFLRRPLIQATTQEFQVSGLWTDPKINKVGRKNSADETKSWTNQSQ